MRPVAPLALLLCSACTSRLGDFSVVSRRAVLGEAPARVAVTTRVTGESCRETILFFIPLGGKADLADAFDAALAASPGANALLDVTVRRKTLLTVFYNQTCFVVEGAPVAIGGK